MDKCDGEALRRADQWREEANLPNGGRKVFFLIGCDEYDRIRRLVSVQNETQLDAGVRVSEGENAPVVDSADATQYGLCVDFDWSLNR